jgi:Concanavalin A-like lectin/glucanases superfamily
MSAFNDRVLGLHFNGSNGSVTFTDNCPNPKTVNRFGGIALSTAQSKFGVGSVFFNGSSQYLTISDHADFDLPGAFTLEFWVRFTSTTGAQSYIFSFLNGSNPSYIIHRDDANKLRLSINFTPVITGSTNIANNAWNHIALVKNGSGLCTLYLNGVSQGSSTQAAGLTPTGIVIGSNPGSLGANLWDGYLDEMMLTKGVAKWSANFTPPASEYSDSTTVDGEITGVGVIQNVTGTASLVVPDYFSGTGVIQSLTGSAEVFVASAVYGDGTIQPVIGSGDINVSPGIVGSGFVQNILGDAYLAVPNFFNGSGVIQSVTGDSTIRHYLIVDKKQIVGRRYRAKITDTTDYYFPISSISLTLRPSASGSVTLVCPDGITYAASIIEKSRANDATITLYEDEIYFDGSVETTDKTITNISLSYSRGSRSFSVTLSGSIGIARHSTPHSYKLEGIQFETLQGNGNRRIRCDLNKDIMPGDYVTSFDGSELVVGSVQYIIASNTKAMEIAEAGA